MAGVRQSSKNEQPTSADEHCCHPNSLLVLDINSSPQYDHTRRPAINIAPSSTNVIATMFRICDDGLYYLLRLLKVVFTTFHSPYVSNDTCMF